MTVVRSNDVNARVPDQLARAISQAKAYCDERLAAVEVIKGWPPAAARPGAVGGNRLPLQGLG